MRERERKKINYAAFGDDDDDDFADPSPQEKKKSANKENKEKSKKSDRAVKPVKGTQRLSLEEKLFERDLQAALNLSASESQVSSDGGETLKPEDNSHQVTVTVERAPPPSCIQSSVMEPNVNSGKVDQSDIDLKPGSNHQSQHVITARKRPAEGEDEEEDEVIQILESDILSGEQPSKRRRVTSAPKKSKYVDSDSDGSEFGMDSDSDESFSGGDDSDFDDGSKSKSKASKVSSATNKRSVATKTKPAPSAVAKTKPAVSKTKSAPAAKVQKPATQLQSTTGKTVVRKSVSSPGGATVSPQNRPKASTKGPKTSWTPPAPSSSCKSAVGGNSMTSPSAGIRLGLSRNQRVKSLHPSLRVQQ